MKKKKLEEHILEVDHLQSQHYMELRNRIDQLEYKLESMRQLIERGNRDWINTPFPQYDPTYKVTCITTPQQPHEFSSESISDVVSRAGRE